MTAVVERADPDGRTCSRCAAVMVVVALRTGRVWRCPQCHRLEL